MPHRIPTDTDSPGNFPPSHQDPLPLLDTLSPPINADTDSQVSSPTPSPTSIPTPTPATPLSEPVKIWVPFPEGTKWINSNQRLHHHQKAKLTRAWRTLAADLTADRPERPEVPARIVAVIHKDSRRRYDPNNLNPTTKACLDGFVESGIFPDDDHHHVIGPDHRHGGVHRDDPGIMFYITPYDPLLDGIES